mgnify:CR=1 FL=1
MKRFLPAEFPLTGCDEFDLQCLNVVVGTRVSATQSSTYIASARETQRGGRSHARGEVRDADILSVIPAKTLDEAPQMRRRIIAETQSMPAYLYAFHHWSGGKRVTHGHVLTRTAENLHQLLGAWPAANDHSRAVVESMTSYVSNPPETVAGVLELAREAGRSILPARFEAMPIELRNAAEMLILGSCDPSGDYTDSYHTLKFILGNDEIVPSSVLEPHAGEMRQILAGLSLENRQRIRDAISQTIDAISAGSEPLAPAASAEAVITREVFLAYAQRAAGEEPN